MALDSGTGKTLTRIVGIVLVRNEDRFVRRVVENITGFCDRIILADNASTDGTATILRDLAESDPGRREYHRLESPAESHGLLADLAGSDTWVFGVDGDEIYDPKALETFRVRLLFGEFSNSWMIMGNVLNCVRLNREDHRASGYLAPPSRSMTKLYNFAAIDSWDGNTAERLHGGTIRFRAGFSADFKRTLQFEYPWEESPLRCLHMCFLRRSSLEPENAAGRQSNMEMRHGGWGALYKHWLHRLLNWKRNSSWKQECYRRGPLVTLDTRPFLSHDI